MLSRLNHGDHVVFAGAGATGTALHQRAIQIERSAGAENGYRSGCPADPRQSARRIIVTAPRRAENLQRAAIPVDVISAQDILKGGVSDPTALGTLAPSLTATQTNAQLTFAPKNDNWAISGYIRNLENNRYAIAAVSYSIAGAVVANTAPPRTYGIRGSFKF